MTALMAINLPFLSRFGCAKPILGATEIHSSESSLDGAGGRRFLMSGSALGRKRNFAALRL